MQMHQFVCMSIDNVHFVYHNLGIACGVVHIHESATVANMRRDISATGSVSAFLNYVLTSLQPRQINSDSFKIMVSFLRFRLLHTAAGTTTLEGAVSLRGMQRIGKKKLG